MENLPVEMCESLATVQDVAEARWDAMHQVIAIAVKLGADAGPHARCWVTLKPQAAKRLLSALQQALAETPDAKGTRQ